ncbi:MAG: hypothetical protein JXJ04_06995 [Spirochaetales bacterium]|nr:hypothetical protein [Spirochaetales bacterium]
MKHTSLLPLCIIFIVCTGCSFYSPNEEVTILMPDIPVQWELRFRRLSFCILYCDAAGVKKSENLASGEISCTIELPKLRNWPVIAIPFGDTFVLPSAGGFYSGEVDEKGSHHLFLSWEHGFSASLLLDCSGQGLDITSFNIQRFSEEVLNRSGGDPWNLDYSYIAEKLIDGDFRVTSIKMLPGKDVSLFLGRGKWFFSSPFSPLYEIDSEQAVCFDNVSFGFHRLFNTDALEWYELYIDEKETVTLSYGFVKDSLLL